MVLPEEVAFTLAVPTKGTKPDETVQGFFTRYPSEARLCPVNCFEQYLATTKDLREIQQGKPNNLFISLVKSRSHKSNYFSLDSSS